jgi:Domain of unknown function (DUF4365)
VAKKSLPPGKQRTREHVIADLSVNHVERFALRSGFTAERIWHDYGLDLVIFTFDKRGFRENGQIWMQLKASDRLKKSHDGSTAAVRIERRDILAWIREVYPVILVLYDARDDVAYYLSIKEYFGGPDAFAKISGATVTLLVPTTNRLNEMAMRKFASVKKAILPS